MSDAAEWDDLDEGDALEQAERFYGSVGEFVRGFLIVTYRREVSPKGEFRWDRSG